MINLFDCLKTLNEQRVEFKFVCEEGERKIIVDDENKYSELIFFEENDSVIFRFKNKITKTYSPPIKLVTVEKAIKAYQKLTNKK